MYLVVFYFLVLIYTYKRAVKRAVINTYMRSLCKTCGERPCAVNYYKEGRPFYRSKCDTCSRGGTAKKPRWSQLGYHKKDACEKCGYRSKYPEQFNVFHIDGNLNNCRHTNLKTICANCQRILHKEGVRWRQGDLTPDL
jgi:hypothetical protein